MLRTTLRALGVLLATLGLVAVVSAAPASANPAQKSGGQRGYTQVTVAPDTLAALVSLGVTPAPVEPGVVVSGDPLALRFPITGYGLNNLRIRHSGGLTLTAGDTVATITNFNIDLGRLRVSADVAGVGRADLFKIRFSDRTDLGLVKLVLTETAATTLNSVFGVTAFTEDLTFGYATPRPFARI